MRGKPESMRSASTRRWIRSGPTPTCPRTCRFRAISIPLALLAGGEALDKAVRRVLSALEERPHVFNLGHGIGQFTPIEHVEQMFRLLGKAA